jgi:hypothetical protein
MGSLNLASELGSKSLPDITLTGQWSSIIFLQVYISLFIVSINFGVIIKLLG